MSITIWRAVLIKSVGYNERFLSSSNAVQKALDYQSDWLYNDEKINVYFHFGVLPTLAKNDRVSKWDTSYQGEV